MSRRSGLTLSLGPLLAAWRRSMICLVLALGACTPAASAPQAGGEGPVGLPLASWGVCAAMLAVPDTSAAERAFTNLAHDQLHSLAADGRLSRAMSARILETMGAVETDFGRRPATATLAGDLAELHAAADVALRALGLTAPACAT
jgi:hypothetical protein